MNGVHDMGGMHGFGPVQPEKDEPVFQEPWEGRMFGMMMALGRHGVHDPDGLRAAIEHMEPARYLASEYFERWLFVTEKALLAKGLVTRDELDARTRDLEANPDQAAQRREDSEATQRLMRTVYTRGPSQRDADLTPRFRPGDSVAVRNIHPEGHTRLPRYVRGKRGVVTRLHGIHDFHDRDGSKTRPGPQPVYNVRIEASELWGDAAENSGSLYIDLWESYLGSPEEDA
jgi:nitrile hydratase